MRRLLAPAFGARAQVGVGAALFLGSVVGWPLTALTVFAGEPQGILGLSWGAMVLAGYNVMATGLGYRATERVETAVNGTIEADQESPPPWTSRRIRPGPDP